VGTRVLILVLFFISGASGLIYEVLWARMPTLSFGVTVLAAATVMAAFMGGLALGSYLFGRWADRWG
jgi:spermidine synthase